MYFDLLDHTIRGPDVVTFLAELHRRLGPLTVIWDRNQIHSKAKVVKAWLARHAGVVVEDLPGYVPDLNPDQGVWGLDQVRSAGEPGGQRQTGTLGSRDR